MPKKGYCCHDKGMTDGPFAPPPLPPPGSSSGGGRRQRRTDEEPADVESTDSLLPPALPEVKEDAVAPVVPLDEAPVVTGPGAVTGPGVVVGPGAATGPGVSTQPSQPPATQPARGNAPPPPSIPADRTSTPNVPPPTRTEREPDAAAFQPSNNMTRAGQAPPPPALRPESGMGRSAAVSGPGASNPQVPAPSAPQRTDIALPVNDHRDAYYVSVAQMIDWIRSHPLEEPTEGQAARTIPLCIWGTAGVGKTQQVKAYCREHGLQIHTYHPAHDRDAADIVGEKYLDEETHLTKYAKPHWLPGPELAAGQPDPDNPGETINGGILFIDEINRASTPSVLAGLMQVLGEGSLSQSGWVLPKGWSIVTAANPPDTKYEVQKMDDAMVDRMLHFSPGVDLPLWAVWAQNNGVHEHVINWTLQHQEEVQVGYTHLPESIDPVATPRSLQYFSTLYDPQMPPALLKVVAVGLLGMDAAESFMDMLSDNQQPVTVRDIASGAYASQFELWRQNDREDLIRASIDLLVAYLAPRPETSARPPEIATLVSFLESLDDIEVTLAIKTMERSAPQWVNVFLDFDKGRLRHRMPHFQYLGMEKM